jgi:hypothetical protein
MLVLRHLPRLGLGAITALGRNELCVFQRLSNDTAQRLGKTSGIVIFALIKSERLFIQIPEQMKRLNVYIRSVQRAFEKRPEVFQAIRMDVTYCIANGMVDNATLVIAFKIVVRHKCVGADRRTLFDMLANVAAEFGSARIRNYFQYYTGSCLGCAALQDTLHSGFLESGMPTPVRLSLCMYRAFAPM